jgi:hypothetical protein
MTINNNKKDLRQKKTVVYRKLTHDKGALAMMYGKYEKP